MKKFYFIFALFVSLSFYGSGCQQMVGEVCPHDPSEGTLEIHDISPANPTLGGNLRIVFCGDFRDDGYMYAMEYGIRNSQNTVIFNSEIGITTDRQTIANVPLAAPTFEVNRTYYIYAELRDFDSSYVRAIVRPFTIGTVQTVRPACIDATTRTFAIEYDYMYDTIQNISMELNTGAYLNTFYDKGNINLSFNSKLSVNPHVIINTNKGSSGEVSNALRTYRLQNGPQDVRAGYLCGIDSLSKVPTADEEIYGYANVYPRRSFVLTGKIRRKLPNEFASARDRTTAHELGHQLGVPGDHLGHGGNDMDCCIMKWPMPNGCRVIFCDNHICQMYDTLSSSQEDNIAGSMSSPTNCNIEITLNISKTVFVEGEDIWVEVTYENKGNTIDSLFNYNTTAVEQSLIVTNMAGIKMDYHGLESHKLPGYLKMKPGEKFTRSINLNFTFGYIQQANEIFASEYYFPADRYTIRAFNDEPELKRYIESNNIMIQVIKPDFNQSIELNELREIYNMPTKEKENLINKRDAFKNFLLKYPNSIYFEQVFASYTSLIGIGELGYSENAIQEAMNFINTYPNSYVTSSAIWYGKEASLALGSKSKAKEFLQKIMTTYKYYRAGKEAEDIYESEKNKLN